MTDWWKWGWPPERRIKSLRIITTGIFSKRTLIGIGDKNHGASDGKEAVIPLDRLFSELNQQFDRQNKALSRNNNGTTTIVVELDGEVVAKSVHKHEKEMTKRGQMSWDFL